MKKGSSLSGFTVMVLSASFLSFQPSTAGAPTGTDPLNQGSELRRPMYVSTYAGGPTAGGQDGYRTNATFFRPASIRLDAQGRIWVTEAYVLNFDEVGVGGHRIRVVDTNGMVSTFAGSAEPGMVDGPVASARFSAPTDVIFDSHGNVLVVDNNNSRIRKIDTHGIVSTLAGSTRGFRDGAGTNAQFHLPYCLAIDTNDNLYLADFGNLSIRRITPLGEVTTVAGGSRGYRDGKASEALFDSPNDVVFRRDGTLLISDWGNSKIRALSPVGIVTTLLSGLPGYVEQVDVDAEDHVYTCCSGPILSKFSADGRLIWSFAGGGGFQDGPLEQARFGSSISDPIELPDGSLVVVDAYNNRLRQITLGTPSLVSISPAGGFFTNAVWVSISPMTSKAIIRYTLDGTEPEAFSPAYTGAFRLFEATTVKARVFVNGYPVSETASAQFTRFYAIDDGIPASWREHYFGAGYQTNPRVMANADPDGDGANNLEEYLAETNPLDPQSVLKVLSIHSVPVVTWNSVSNVIYFILRKDNMNSTNWTTVAAVQANASITSFTDYSATNTKAFYWISPKP
jgi:Chitobiase/beta-hexosaminidase C-terminal domain